MRRRAALLFAVLLTSACGEEPVTLIVQVRTDLAPVHQFHSVSVAFDDRAATRFARTDADWGAGVRVVETELPLGEHRFSVAVRDIDDVVLVSRPVRVVLESPVTVVTVLLTASCAGVSCPGDSGPMATACLAGRCVEDRCSEEAGATCGPAECERDADCMGPLPSCVLATCSAGVCFESPDHDACGAEGVCSTTDGCVLPGERVRFSDPVRLFELELPGGRPSHPTVAPGRRELVFVRSSETAPAPGQLWTSVRGSVSETWGAPSILTVLNSANDDTQPRLARDLGSIWFASDRPGVMRTHSILVATRMDDAFGAPELDLGFSTSEDDSSPGVDRSQRIAFQTRGRLGASDIVELRRANRGEMWGPATAVSPVNTTDEESSPEISRDGLTLYFVSDRPGGIGGRDLWVARRITTASPFGEPVNLDELNSPDDEGGPSISSSGGHLYFHSTRDSSTAIWVASR